ncbi:MAG: hypothetical protein ACR2RB_20510 [Gammaproteobacteria bacterium]
MIPLQLDGVEGGELTVYRGHYEDGTTRLERGEELPWDRQLRISHAPGYSTMGQYMRLLHRVSPIRSGTRVTLNLNLRSATRPYIDDNSLCYLAADNPDLGFISEMVKDLRTRQLPTYMHHAANQ